MASKPRKPRTVKPAPAAVAPEATAPAAEPGGNVEIVVKGPKAGFRRAGLLFGSMPRRLGPADIGADIEGARRLLAIVREPRLDVRLHMLDGTARPFAAEEIEVLDHIVSGIPETQLDKMHVATIAQLTGSN